jgi:hypothetical protein
MIRYEIGKAILNKFMAQPYLDQIQSCTEAKNTVTPFSMIKQKVSMSTTFP